MILISFFKNVSEIKTVHLMKKFKHLSQTYYMLHIVCLGCAAGTLLTKLKPLIKISLQSGGYRHRKIRFRAIFSSSAI
jgi:hypothetical protein